MLLLFGVGLEVGGGGGRLLLPPKLSESDTTFSGWSCYGRCSYCCYCRCASIGDLVIAIVGNGVYVVVDGTGFDAYGVDDATTRVTDACGAIHIIASVVVYYYY